MESLLGRRLLLLAGDLSVWHVECGLSAAFLWSSRRAWRDGHCVLPEVSHHPRRVSDPSRS